MAGSNLIGEPRHVRPVLGVFAGGRGRRMGGLDKGRLRVSEGGPTLLERWAELGRALDLEVVLLGGAGAAGLETLPDEPPGCGPLGGLGPLLLRAGERAALAVACDMPFVGRALLWRLATAPTKAAVLAPRDSASGRFHPMFARYDPSRVAPALAASLAAGERSFQALFRRLEVEELSLSAAQWQELSDWDRPEDMHR